MYVFNRVHKVTYYIILSICMDIYIAYNSKAPAKISIMIAIDIAMI